MDMAQIGLVTVVIMLVVSVGMLFVWGFLLAAANRVANGFWAPYWRSLGTVVVVAILSALAGWLVGKIASIEGFWVEQLVGLVLTVVIGGWIFSAFVRRKDGSPLGFAAAAKAYLMLAVLGVLFAWAMQPLTQKMQAAAEQQAGLMQEALEQVQAAPVDGAADDAVGPDGDAEPAAEGDPDGLQ